MKNHTRSLLEKATATIGVAKILAGHGNPDAAGGQAYYAMHYVVEALLNEKGLKTKEMDTRSHRWLIDRMLGAFAKRPAGEYGAGTDLAKHTSTYMIDQAREFLEGAQAYLGR